VLSTAGVQWTLPKAEDEQIAVALHLVMSRRAQR
jgi:hypothetical protein